MRPIRLTLSAAGVSTPVILDHYRDPFNVGVGVTVSGTGPSYSVEYTYDDVFSSTFNPSTAQWFAMSAFPAATATSKDSALTTPVMAVRLNVAAITGSITMNVIQAGMPGL
jgi:hypothetical protein